MASFSHTCGKICRGSDSDSDDESSAAIPRVKRRKIEDYLMEKNKLCIAAVQANDVEALTNLSDATEWHKLIEPNTGDTLLHIAVKRRNKKIFDYLLANVDVPVNCTNKNGDTALSLYYLRWLVDGEVFGIDNYFACELIKKGASVDSVHLKYGDTFFHLMDLLRLAAVKWNDVEALARLSDTTEWYKYIEPDTGNTLLHMALKSRSKDTFDYLLAIVDVPVNCKNDEGHTVLDLCFYEGEDWGWGERSADHYVYELMKKDTSMSFNPLEDGETLLHLAVSKGFVKVSKLLMDIGHDLNALDDAGRTPFWNCLARASSSAYAHSALDEIVAAFLCHGYDPGVCSSYNAFEEVVYRFSLNHYLQKLLLDFLIDDSAPIHFEIILQLAEWRSPLFQDAVERAKNMILVKPFHVFEAITYLFTMDADHLDLLIKKCPDAIREAFACLRYICIKGTICTKKFVENANMLLESDLRDDTIDFMCRMAEYVLDHRSIEKDESAALSCACFLLSYGLKLKEQVLIEFNEAYGYGESLKILLHMEIETGLPYWMTWSPFGLLLYDVNCDLEQILDNSEEYSPQDVEQLIYYFSDARLRALCDGSVSAEISATIKNQPDVPLLSELARNVFRKHLVKRFNVTKANQFYTLVNGLPIPPAHKKMITLETKLY